MKTILLGTTNRAKIQRFREMLSEYEAEFITPTDLGIQDEPEEDGNTPIENSRTKAKFYGKYFDAVICNDSGLYFDGLELDDVRQPGLHIRTPNGQERLDDEAMIQYYSELIHSLGGKVLAYYLDGVAVYHRGEVFTFMESREASRHTAFYMVDQPSDIRHAGWPLDSLSLNQNTMTYFVEEGDNKYDAQEEDKVLGEHRRHFVDFVVSSLQLEKRQA